jgi:hypothetical protein
VDATSTRIEYELEPVERRLRDAAERDLRTALGDQVFERCCRGGEQLNDANVMDLVSAAAIDALPSPSS